MPNKNKFSQQQEKVIGEFLGIPKESFFHSTKDPIPFENLVNNFITRHKLDKELVKTEQVLFESWEYIFGSFSERCHPVKITHRGCLIISISNPTLRSEINFRKDEILAKIRGFKACEEIKDLLFKS